MNPEADFWEEFRARRAVSSETRAVEPCPCVTILAEQTALAVDSVVAAWSGDDVRSDALVAEVGELQAILENHLKGLVSTAALLDWKHAREEQARFAS